MKWREVKWGEVKLSKAEVQWNEGTSKSIRTSKSEVK